ncbi:hypothetical protein [Streptomyces poriferorum]|uniref:Aminoglycoside phosphotransferase domain-containing protein n=1 Tax=Streptomyces poriferorum TaxID=2798799 RepID=A0ABY9IQ42_9ACTN|nr:MULTISPECIES: hypothetical protein [unclassified Streptomyces]MDP5314385.1 hypothetical protein [Streptomyces sp. Alt4]WLQ56696.1 hypothetical protein P8A19_15130 [Streptomyces sp. Alt2]
MTHADLNTGMVWRLHHGDQEIARLNVTGADMPWMHADIEELPGFEEFRPVFTEQEQAADEEDWDRLADCFERIRSALTMTFPDGTPGRRVLAAHPRRRHRRLALVRRTARRGELMNPSRR